MLVNFYSAIKNSFRFLFDAGIMTELSLEFLSVKTNAVSSKAVLLSAFTGLVLAAEFAISI